MDYNAVMAELEAQGTEQYRRIYARHGAPANLFGVSYAALGALAKRIKRDHALAVQLWNSGNFDARNLACFIGDASQLSAAELDKWAAQVCCYPVSDSFAGRFCPASPHALKLVDKWVASKKEFVRRSGYSLASALAGAGKLPAEKGAELIARIEQDISSSPNRAREGMNWALIGLGMSGLPGLKEQALAAAQRIGPVDVDHGETGCKTPDARTYINKTAPKRAAKQTG